MCWVALDRASKLAEDAGDPEHRRPGFATAEEIHADILEHGISDRGVMRQHYETDSLDASNLLAALLGFLPGDDERLHKTVLATAEELTENGFVLRYKTEETDDGLSGKEGTFLICSFYLLPGKKGRLGRRARDLMERAAQSGLAARPLRPRNSTRRPGTTSATSRKPSPSRPDRGGGADADPRGELDEIS